MNIFARIGTPVDCPWAQKSSAVVIAVAASDTVAPVRLLMPRPSDPTTSKTNPQTVRKISGASSKNSLGSMGVDMESVSDCRDDFSLRGEFIGRQIATIGYIQLADDVVDRFLQNVEKRLWIDSNPETE